jgi:TonB family protein
VGARHVFLLERKGWIFMRNRQVSSLLSIGIHAALAALLFTVSFNPGGIVHQPKISTFTALIAPAPPPALLDKDPAGGGGGGGKRAPLPASRGDLPKAAIRQYVPPAVVRENPEPRLIMEPTIVVASNAPLPVTHFGQIGDPLALPGPPSDGPGHGGGIGNGDGTGVGPGNGAGAGAGNKYGHGGGDPAGGAGGRGVITPAALVWKIEPEYSDEARRAKVQGTVLLLIVVDQEGKPGNVQVRQSLGLGLDQKAIEAVSRWKFRPGKRNGRAVATSALVEVNFRLL